MVVVINSIQCDINCSMYFCHSFSGRTLNLHDEIKPRYPVNNKLMDSVPHMTGANKGGVTP